MIVNREMINVASHKIIRKIELEPGGELASAAKIGREKKFFIAITLFPQRDAGHS